VQPRRVEPAVSGLEQAPYLLLQPLLDGFARARRRDAHDADEAFDLVQLRPQRRPEPCAFGGARGDECHQCPIERLEHRLGTRGSLLGIFAMLDEVEHALDGDQTIDARRRRIGEIAYTVGRLHDLGERTLVETQLVAIGGAFAGEADGDTTARKVAGDGLADFRLQLLVAGR
jgi:hypothetical protein